MNPEDEEEIVVSPIMRRYASRATWSPERLAMEDELEAYQKEHQTKDVPNFFKIKRDAIWEKENAGRRYRQKTEKRKLKEGQSKCYEIFLEALASGRLVEGPCEHCRGRNPDRKTYGHHPDTREPLQAIWLCRAHNAAEHARVLKIDLDNMKCDDISAVKFGAQKRYVDQNSVGYVEAVDRGKLFPDEAEVKREVRKRKKTSEAKSSGTLLEDE